MIFRFIAGFLILTNISSNLAASLFLWHIKNDPIYTIDFYGLMQIFYLVSISFNVIFLITLIKKYSQIKWLVWSSFLVFSIFLIIVSIANLKLDALRDFPYLSATLVRNRYLVILPLLAWLLANFSFFHGKVLNVEGKAD